MTEKILNLANHFYFKMIDIRRYIHQNPELSGQEKNTAEFICSQLDLLHIPYQKEIAGFGVVAQLVGAGNGTPKNIALRADIDALPIQERNEVSYRSVNDGIMHACGHDFHCASLLGALMILNEMRNQFSGTVKAIFQPSEERCEGGAPFMIAEGVLEIPRVDRIYALHAETAIKVGEVGFCAGKYMASTDELFLTVHGKGGHAALLNETINPIFIASTILFELQNSVNHLFENSNTELVENKFVLNFGKFIANGATNVIPDTVEIAGTLRLFDEEKRIEIRQIIEKLPVEIATKMNGKCDVFINYGYPAVINDENETKFAIEVAEKIVGKENIKTLLPKCSSEDFSYFLQKVPGTFFRVGVSNPEKGITYTTHQNRFDIDEEALKIGAAMFVGLVLKNQNQNNQSYI